MQELRLIDFITDGNVSEMLYPFDEDNEGIESAETNNS